MARSALVASRDLEVAPRKGGYFFALAGKLKFFREGGYGKNSREFRLDFYFSRAYDYLVVEIPQQRESNGKYIRADRVSRSNTK